MVKVDERKKLCLTNQKFIYNYHLYVDAGRKKEGMETEMTESARRRQHIMLRKSEETQTLSFF